MSAAVAHPIRAYRRQTRAGSCSRQEMVGEFSRLLGARRSDQEVLVTVFGRESVLAEDGGAGDVSGRVAGGVDPPPASMVTRMVPSVRGVSVARFVRVMVARLSVEAISVSKMSMLFPVSHQQT